MILSKPQLWMLVGGNGAGKSSFYDQFLKARGIPFVNADLIAKEYFPEDPEGKSREAADLAEGLRYRLMKANKSFCFETVFSHVSKIDFIGDAKAAGYEIVMVFIHLDIPALNKARIQQRVKDGGHNVPDDRVEPRIERLTQNVRKVIALGLADQVHVLDNSSYENPFVHIVQITGGQVTTYVDPLPDWALGLFKGTRLLGNY